MRSTIWRSAFWATCTSPTPGRAQSTGYRTPTIVSDPNLKITAANGIAVSPGGNTLYVAGFPDGITVVDLHSHSWRALPHPANLCLATIDGLYYQPNELIAIQNGVMTHRVVRYQLTADLTRIRNFEVLERRNPLFDGITTGTIANGTFYFMANTQLDKLSGGTIQAGARLDPIKILAIKLTR